MNEPHLAWDRPPNGAGARSGAEAGPPTLHRHGAVDGTSLLSVISLGQFGDLGLEEADAS